MKRIRIIRMHLLIGIAVVIYFFSGPDEFRLKEALAEALEKAKADFGIPANETVFSVRTGDEKPERLFSYLETVDMFSAKKIALVEDAGRLPKAFRGELLEYLKRRDTTRDPSVQLFITDSAEGKGDDALFSFLAKKPVEVRRFPQLAGRDLEQLIRDEGVKRGLKFERGLETLFLRFHQDNLREISQELEKLALYLGATPGAPKTASEQDVRKLGWERVSQDAWQLVDAVGKKDKGAVLGILLRVLESGEDEIKFLGLLVYMVRAMLMVKDASTRRIRPADIPRATKLAQFQVRQYLAASAPFSLEELKKIYERLLVTDFRMKTGEGKPRVLLEKFLLSV